jgi:hypothetical protein
MISALFLSEQIEAVAPEASQDERAAQIAREVVPPGKTVVGEWVYWWLFEDERFRANSTIWLQAWQHPEESFADSFHRICPDYVLFEDLWLARYAVIGTQDRFPNMAPSDTAERGRLMAVLRDEYEVVRRVPVDERTLTFWRRSEADCPRPASA